VIVLFLNVAVIVGVCVCGEGSGVVLVCVKFVTLWCRLLRLFRVGWI
jgi:hypothetical protein